MSWLFSQALVAEYLEESSSDGEQSVQSSGSHIQQAYCAPDKMTVFSRLSRFGMTFKPLTVDRGEELLTLYLAAFHARTSQQQEEAQELMESEAECGNTWRGSFVKYDHDSSSWRTHQCSLLGDLEPFSETWPRWGLMHDGECWEQQTWALRTSEIESGSPDGETFFHTPNCSGLDGGSNSRKALKKRQENWPTPDANCGQRGTQPNWTPIRKSGQPAQYSLNQAVRDRQTWPTPLASDWKPRGPNSKQQGLREKVKAFPTPTAHNAKECASPSEHNRNTPTLATHAGGKLNPDWVEWLMNWPIKWSDINEFNPKEFQRWQETSATPLQESVQMRTVWWDADPSQASHRPQHEQQQQQQYSDTLQQVSRGTSCESTMERSHEGQDLLVLRDSVHLQTTKRENLQSGVWEQTCMDETKIVPRVGGTGIATVDRLKAIGNGQVPLCAATAWKLLNE